MSEGADRVPSAGPDLRAALHAHALAHLARYAASRQALRRVLLRRLRRLAPGLEAAAARAVLDAVLDRLAALRLIDDQALALARADSLNRAGRSMRAIAQELAARGIDRQARETAMRALVEDDPEAELAAAWRLARRKRLGPFRAVEERAAARAADLVTLRRAGFPAAIAREVVTADPEDAPDP